MEGLLESREQHLARHSEDAIRKKCPRCQYYACCKKLQRDCSWIVQLTNETFTWLIEHPLAETGSHVWGLGCSLCRWARVKSPMARCEKQTLDKLARHQKCREHQQALLKWNAVQNSTSMGAAGSAATGSKTPEVNLEGTHENVGYGHVIKMLELFQEQKSIRSFTRSVQAARIMRSDLNPGNESRTVATNLVSACAGYELSINRTLLMHCAIWGLGQDGKDQALLVASRMVLWSLPSSMRANLPNGVTTLLPSRFGSRGPWVAERALGCAELGSDRGGAALAEASLGVLHTILPAPDDFKAVAKKGKFFTADNAADETVAHRHLRDELEALDFDIPDTTHSVMLAIKNGCKGDPEVDLVRGVFITNKRPVPSISRCLQNSTRFRTKRGLIGFSTNEVYYLGCHVFSGFLYVFLYIS